MARLEMAFLGGFHVELDGSAVNAFASNKTRALLAYLAVECDRARSREELCGLLWPDYGPEAAQNNLRNTLSGLRDSIGDRQADPPFLLITRTSVQFNRAANAHADVWALRDEKRPADQRAAAYQGALLQGFSLPDSAPFEDWLESERATLGDQAQALLGRLAEEAERSGDYPQALRWARLQLEMEPWREEAHRQVMRALALQGECSAALKQYEVCRRLLEKELEVAPGEETRRLAEGIRSGEWPGEPVVVGEKDLFSGPEPHPRHNLPLQLTSFIGREKEIEHILGLLRQNRLVTLTGSGGTGKTRLALRAADHALVELASLFADGIWLVDLAPLEDPQILALTAASALGLKESAGRAPVQQLMDFLEKRHLLLVLDNCEHLASAVGVLVERLLKKCTGLRVLATSREILGVNGEVPFRCPSLDLPVSPNLPALAELARVEGVALFVERAQIVYPGFHLTEENAAVVVDICRRIEGIPLAIELAAARMTHMSPVQILERLNDRFCILTGGSRFGLPRHQTLRASIDWSYSLLSAQERLLLQRLSVFAGGWTLESAEQVCGFGELNRNEILGGVASLVNKSILIYNPQASGEPRYHMLETLRQYALEKLAEAKEVEQVKNHHLVYFLDMVERIKSRLRGREQIASLDRIEAELDNLRRALSWGLQAAPELELRLAARLMWFWHLRSRKQEGLDWLEKGLVRAEGAEISPEVRAWALMAAGFHHNMLWELDTSHKLLLESLRIFQELGQDGKAGAVWTMNFLGCDYSLDPQVTAGYCRQALEDSYAVNDAYLTSECLQHLSNSLWTVERGSPEARRCLKECLRLRLQIGDPEGIATAYFWFGAYARDELKLVQARAWLQKSLDLYLRVGNQDLASCVYNDLGSVARLAGHHLEANALYRSALEIQGKVVSNPYYISEAYSGIGEGGLILSDHHLAREYIFKALECGEKNHQPGWVKEAHILLGELAWGQGNFDQARIEFAYQPIQTVTQEHWSYLSPIAFEFIQGPVNGMVLIKSAIHAHLIYLSRRKYWEQFAVALDLIACAGVSNRPKWAARCYGAAERMNPYLVNDLIPPIRVWRESALSTLRSVLGNERMRILWEEGKALSNDAIVALALAE